MLRKAMPPARLRLHDRVAYRLLRCTLGGGKGSIAPIKACPRRRQLSPKAAVAATSE